MISIVWEELDIEEEFIDLGVDDLRRERTELQKTEQMDMQRRRKLFDRLFNSFSTSFGLGIGLLIVIVLGVLAARWIQSLPAPVREETIIRRTIIEAPVVETKSLEACPEIQLPNIPVQDVPEQVVELINDSKDLATDPPDLVGEDSVEEVDSEELDQPEKQDVDIPSLKSGASLRSRLSGKWELKYYWLYEDGSDQPIVVPVTVEPSNFHRLFPLIAIATFGLWIELSFSATYAFRVARKIWYSI